MPWGKIDDRAWRHDRFDGVDPMSYALFWAAISFSNEKLLDGHLKTHHIAQVCGYRGIPTQAADRLIESGLWITEGDGISIHDYDQYNPSKAEVLKRRADGKERQARWLAAQKADQEGDTAKDAVTDAHATSETESPDSVSDETIPVPRYPGTPVPGNPDPTIRPPTGGRSAGAAQAQTPKAIARQIWDALGLALHHTPNDKNPVERGPWNTAIAGLILAGETTETIPRLVALYRERWPDMECTPMALAKHHSLLKSGPVPLAEPASLYDAPRFNGGETARALRDAEQAELARYNQRAPPKGDGGSSVDAETAAHYREEIKKKVGSLGHANQRPTYPIQ